ncbi:MAG: AbrB/MazE/SpoVT family DNA-binding domain-containing protein [Magnetococcales bacterium]|nr:AbrB/MazE/SpoVT family DNA-binding domain-containing protein [Magnetococcales bacterium]
MRISERGQVTIPQAIRERFGLLPNTEVEFVEQDGEIKLVKSQAERKRLINNLYGQVKSDRTTDELMALLRD